MSLLLKPAGGAVEAFSGRSEVIDPSSADLQEEDGVKGDEGDETEGRGPARHGVLAAGPGSPGVPGATSPPSSTVSVLSCKERSADVEFSTEESSVSGASPRGGSDLCRVTPSSPLRDSTRRLQERPK